MLRDAAFQTHAATSHATNSGVNLPVCSHYSAKRSHPSEPQWMATHLLRVESLGMYTLHMFDWLAE